MTGGGIVAMVALYLAGLILAVMFWWPLFVTSWNYWF